MYSRGELGSQMVAEDWISFGGTLITTILKEYNQHQQHQNTINNKHEAMEVFDDDSFSFGRRHKTECQHLHQQIELVNILHKEEINLPRSSSQRISPEDDSDGQSLNDEDSASEDLTPR